MSNGASVSSISCLRVFVVITASLLSGCTNLYIVSNNVNCKATRAGQQDDVSDTDASGDQTGGSFSRAQQLARAFASDIDCTDGIRSSATAPVVDDDSGDNSNDSAP